MKKFRCYIFITLALVSTMLAGCGTQNAITSTETINTIQVSAITSAAQTPTTATAVIPEVIPTTTITSTTPVIATPTATTPTTTTTAPATTTPGTTTPPATPPAATTLAATTSIATSTTTTPTIIVPDNASIKLTKTTTQLIFSFSYVKDGKPFTFDNYDKAVAIFVVGGRDASNKIISTQLYTLKVPSSEITLTVDGSDLNLVGVNSLEVAFSIQFGYGSGGFVVKEIFPYP
jgi:hypothetical protein